MMKYLCAITLPEDVSLVLSDIQQSYKTAGWQILLPPHITVLPPAVALVSTSQAVDLLRTAVESMHPFYIEVDGAGRFVNGSNTVFAEVKENEDLQILHTKLLKAAPYVMALKPGMREDFNPHITLSNKLSNTLAEQVKMQMDEQRINFAFECSSLSLFKKESTDPKWVELQKLYFT